MIAPALMSLVLPGAGQIALGRVRRGVLLAAAAVGVGALVVALWLAGPLFVLDLLLRQDVLLALLAANFAFFCLRTFAVLDAYRLGRNGTARLGVALAPVVVLLALTAVPHVVAGYYTFRAYDLLTTVFTDDEPADVLPLEPPPAAATPPEAPAGQDPASSTPAPAAPAPVVPQPAVPAQPAPADPAEDDWLSDDVLLGDPTGAPPADDTVPLLDDGSPAGGPSVSGEGPQAAGPAATGARGGWLTLLLIGGDAGPGRSGLRTDTMIVVAIQSGTGKAVAFGVPRNLTAVPLPGEAGRRYGVYDDNILNALYGWAKANPSYFPGGRDPGATALKQSLSLLLGLQIRYYALVDLAGFVDLVDAVDGVDITATERIDDVVSPPHEGEAWIPIDVQPGERYHLNGREALAYARSRHSTSDYNRMQRQRCILSAMALQLDVATVLRRFGTLASVIKRSVQTDVPLRRLPDVVRLIASIDAGKSMAVSFAPPAFTDGVDPGSLGFIPDSALIRTTVADMVLKPASALRGQNGVDTLHLACG